MAEITKSDDVIKKIKEFDTYLSQSSEVLKSLHRIREDVENQTHLLSQKREELTRFESDLSAFRDKAKTVSQEIDKILSPIRKEKEELERLDNKLTVGLARLDDIIQTKIEQGLMVQAETQKAFQTQIENVVDVTRKELDSKIADFLYKQNALVSNLSQQIDSYQRLTESLKSTLENQNQQITYLQTKNSELQNVIESIKQLLEKQSQDFSGALDELRGTHIQQLEKENAEMKSVLNELTTKFNNMKFKKILGL